MPVYVAQGDTTVIFLSEEDKESRECLVETEGVNTCLCVVLKGTYRGAPFILMNHWEGFSLEEKKKEPSDNVKTLIELCAKGIVDTYKDESPTKPVLVNFCLLGGQKSEYDEMTGQLLCSGTEPEVIALQEYARIMCDAFFDGAEKAQYQKAVLLTTGDDTLTVQCFADKVNYSKETVKAYSAGLGVGL